MTDATEPAVDGGMLVYGDKPHHTAQRRIVNKAFLPRWGGDVRASSPSPTSS